jgi:hypothetical protein
MHSPSGKRLGELGFHLTPPTVILPIVEHCSGLLRRRSNTGWRRGCKVRRADGAQLSRRRVIGCERSVLATSNSRWMSRGGSRWLFSEPISPGARTGRTELPLHHRIWRWSRRSMPWLTQECCPPNDATAPSGPAGRRCTDSPNWSCTDLYVTPVAVTLRRWLNERSTTSLPALHADGSCGRRSANSAEREATAKNWRENRNQFTLGASVRCYSRSMMVTLAVPPPSHIVCRP